MQNQRVITNENRQGVILEGKLQKSLGILHREKRSEVPNGYQSTSLILLTSVDNYGYECD